MITNEDIKKLTEVLATKRETDTKFDAMHQVFSDLQVHMDTKFDAMHESFSELQSSVDAYAKKADLYFQEMAAMRHAISRHEEAIRKIAEKTGVKLDY